jgi:hypothetical protein
MTTSDFEIIKDALETAERYISHIGANYTEAGKPHPQQLLLDKLNEALRILKD